MGSVSCGSSHTIAVSKDGKIVWSFGSGESGKLGHGEIVKVHRPKVIEGLRGLVIQKVCAGTSFSLALTTMGQVKAIFNANLYFCSWRIHLSLENIKHKYSEIIIIL